MSAIKRPAALLMALAIVLAAGCGKTDTAPDIAAGELAEARSTTYNTEAAVVGDLVQTATVSVEPLYTSKMEVRSPEGSYKLVSMEVKRGSPVKKGDTLAVLEGVGSPSDVEQLRLELDWARASYEEKRLELKEAAESVSGDGKARELTEKKARAALELYQLEGQAKLAAMEKALEKAEAAVGQTLVTAPFDGFVRSTGNLSPGDLLETGASLATVYDSASLVLYASGGLAAFNYGLPVEVTYEENGETHTAQGRVAACSSLTGMTNGGYAYIRLDRPADTDGWSGIKVSCANPLMRDVVLVPRGAVTSEEGRFYVTLLEGNSTKKRYILRGPQLSEQAAVLQGVSPGELVVTSQYTS